MQSTPANFETQPDSIQDIRHGMHVIDSMASRLANVQQCLEWLEGDNSCNCSSDVHLQSCGNAEAVLAMVCLFSAAAYAGCKHCLPIWMPD